MSAPPPQSFLQTELKAYALPTSYMVNNMTVTVVDPTTATGDTSPGGVPVAIVVSSVLSAVFIFVGMALFTRCVASVVWYGDGRNGMARPESIDGPIKLSNQQINDRQRLTAFEIPTREEAELRAALAPNAGAGGGAGAGRQ